MFLQICRDECEILEYDLCQRELAIARTQPMIHHQLVLPDCHELPVISTTASYNCVRLGMPSVSGQQLIKPHSCYKEDGTDYRYGGSRTKLSTPLHEVKRSSLRYVSMFRRFLVQSSSYNTNEEN